MRSGHVGAQDRLIGTFEAALRTVKQTSTRYVFLLQHVSQTLLNRASSLADVALGLDGNGLNMTLVCLPPLKLALHVSQDISTRLLDAQLIK